MADPENYLGAIGQGLQSGVEAYQKERSYQDEQAFRRKMLAMQMLKGGMQEGADGSVQLNPIEQQKRDTEQQKFDTGSEISRRHRDFTRGLLEAVKPGLGDIIPDDMSASELEEKSTSGLLSKQTSGMLGLQGRQITSDRVAEGNDIKRQGLDIRKDAQASHAADTVHKDKRVMQLTQQLDQLERGRGILDQETITGQEFNDYQQEIQAAISGAGGGALGKLERTEYTTAMGELAALRQKWSGKPQDAVPKEIVERLKALADHTRDIMARHRAERATSLQRTFRSNDAANEEMGKAIKTYAPDKGQPAQGLMNPPAPGQGLMGGGGKVKVSNGKETLMIDRGDLADAMKDGYQEAK